MGGQRKWVGLRKHRRNPTSMFRRWEETTNHPMGVGQNSVKTPRVRFWGWGIKSFGTLAYQNILYSYITAETECISDTYHTRLSFSTLCSWELELDKLFLKKKKTYSVEYCGVHVGCSCVGGFLRPPKLISPPDLGKTLL